LLGVLARLLVCFGHAGSCANSDMEQATTKNNNFREAGAYVPHSFDDLGDVIK
jgi:ATP citrate (pro-S)-lyase